MTATLPVSSLLFASLALAERSSGPGGLLSCLGSLLLLSLLSIVSYCILRARAFLKHSGKGQPDVTNLRSTGKTVVTRKPSNEDDADQFGGVN